MNEKMEDLFFTVLYLNLIVSYRVGGAIFTFFHAGIIRMRKLKHFSSISNRFMTISNPRSIHPSPIWQIELPYQFLGHRSQPSCVFPLCILLHVILFYSTDVIVVTASFVLPFYFTLL